MKGVTIWKDGVELKPYDSTGIKDVSEPASVTVSVTMDADAIRAIVARGNESSVRMLLEHAETWRLPNLRLWCKVWLDPTSDGARKLAEQKLRAWIERGELAEDARL